MKTGKVIEGCEQLGRLTFKPEDHSSLQEFMWGMDTTTKAELLESINGVLERRRKTIEDEIKNLVNE